MTHRRPCPAARASRVARVARGLSACGAHGACGESAVRVAGTPVTRGDRGASAGAAGAVPLAASNPVAGGFLRTPRGRIADRDRGAVLVEFAGLFPLILLMLAVIWQCILIGYTFSLAGNAADEAARAGAAARSDATAACSDAAARHIPGAWSVETDCAAGGTVYRAEVTLRVPALFPGVLDLPFDVPGSAGAAQEG